MISSDHQSPTASSARAIGHSAPFMLTRLTKATSAHCHHSCNNGLNIRHKWSRGNQPSIVNHRARGVQPLHHMNHNKAEHSGYQQISSNIRLDSQFQNMFYDSTSMTGDKN